MKKITLLFSALMAMLLASCMDSGYDTPTEDYNGTQIEKTNLMTIQAVKEKYKSTIEASSFKLVDEDIQIEGVVTGNDAGSNLYNELSLQDNSGAIIVAINQGGLSGIFPVGATVRINLKGLYIGAYGNQAEIGGVYTNATSGATGIGGADRYLWQGHWQIIDKGNFDKANALIEPFDYDKAGDADYIWQNQGKLMRFDNVTFKNGDGKSVFAPSDGSVKLTNNCANRGFVGKSDSKIVFRTSTYADFASDIIPQGQTSVVGIFTIYKSTWQILARDRSDAYGLTGLLYINSDH